MRRLDDLLANNRNWADGVREKDPNFFTRLATQQSPQYLWIGCSDSRVPANQIVGLLPGEVFVHRNVANLVITTDLNCVSVMQYAIDVLKVKHIIVCGHHGCGGVWAAMTNMRFGLIDNWLRHLQDVRDRHQALLDTVEDPKARAERLCELNAIEQACHVCRTTIVQDAWARGQDLTVHAWIYSLKDGLVRDLEMAVGGLEELEPAYKAAVAHVRTVADKGELGY
jgi:carbonic anhydrase